MESDEQLFERWRIEHDHTAFAEIERRHSAAMVGRANCRLTRMGVEGAYHTAEECVDETFLRLALQTHALPHVRNWLYLVLRRLIIEQGRRHGRRPPTYSRDADEDGPNGLEPVDPDLGPLDRILDDPHRLGAILECVNKLPDHLREVVVMHYLEGMSYDEITEQTGLRHGQIASRLDKARRLLADCYTRRLSGTE